MGHDSDLLDAIEAAYRDRGADFFRFALARTSNVELAREAVQEGFARAIRGRGGFRGSGSLEAWVGRCVLNAAHDASRDGPAAGMAWDSPGATSDADSWQRAEVREALSGLPERQRDALFLRHYLDLDYAGIAEALGVEVGTVSATLHAARENMRKALQEANR